MRGADVTSQPNSRQGRGAEAAPRHVTHRPQRTTDRQYGSSGGCKTLHLTLTIRSQLAAHLSVNHWFALMLL